VCVCVFVCLCVCVCVLGLFSHCSRSLLTLVAGDLGIACVFVCACVRVSVCTHALYSVFYY
jgi:hypothetical protein